MKAFKYKARTESGSSVEGVVEANTREEAVSNLKESGLIVESAEEEGGSRNFDFRFGSKKVNEKALAIMCNQFAIILQAGLPIVRAMQLVAGQTEDKTLKGILSAVADDISAGYNLADSFQKQGPELPTTFIETVHAGEASGDLDVVFRRLSTYYEKTSKTKSKVKSAMIYPSFVLVVAFVVIAVIMMFAVPSFKTTFSSMGVELPWITQFMIDASTFWTNYFLVIAALIVALFIAVKLAKKNDAFRLKWSRLGVKLPILGRITLMSAASQYAGTMSVMIEAGLSVVKAVDVTARSMSNYWMSQQLSSTQVDLEAGKPLAVCMGKTEAFPRLVIEMTGVGEQTGSLESTLRVLGEYYDSEVETSSARALSILEPALIVVLAVIVCSVLLAVYLPMFSLYGSL